MADGAKWIKIATETFEDEKIDIIEGMPNGDKMIVIWFKLLLLAGKCNSGGYLMLQEDIPFKKEMLARRFKQEISIIDDALEVFEKFKLIQTTEKGIYITNFNKHQDLDKMNLKRTQDRERKQRQRERDKLLMQPDKGEVLEVVPMSKNMSRNNQRDVTCDKYRDPSYSTSTSYSSSSSNSNSNSSINSNINLNKVVNKKIYIDFFNKNFRQITEYEGKVLCNYEKQGMNPQVITLALKEAVEENARDLKYVRKILDRWLGKGILTVDAVMQDKHEFERKKNTAKTSVNKNKVKQSTFNDYSQREYDFDTLEKQLLGWDRVCQNA